MLNEFEDERLLNCSRVELWPRSLIPNYLVREERREKSREQTSLVDAETDVDSRLGKTDSQIGGWYLSGLPIQPY